MTQTKKSTNWIRIISVTVVILLGSSLAAFFGQVTILAKETILKSLIEAEATILGFFGIIVVYMLQAIDNRQLAIVKQLFNLWGKEDKVIPELEILAKILGWKRFPSMGEICSQYISCARDQRSKTLVSALVISGFLISSLFLSILALGLTDSVFVGYLSNFAVLFFLVSIGFIFLMFKDFMRMDELL